MACPLPTGLAIGLATCNNNPPQLMGQTVAPKQQVFGNCGRHGSFGNKFDKICLCPGQFVPMQATTMFFCCPSTPNTLHMGPRAGPLRHCPSCAGAVPWWRGARPIVWGGALVRGLAPVAPHFPAWCAVPLAKRAGRRHASSVPAALGQQKTLDVACTSTHWW